MPSEHVFDPVEATTEDIRDAVLSGRATCRQIVQSFLARIADVNPLINAVICLNPKVLEEADAVDAALSREKPSGALLGVPIMLKDNFDAVNMKTTGGCLALKDLQPTQDAKVVKALKDAGAIILGKVNMHEMALEGLTVSSLGGQTLNPYDLTRTPGGSSGGSGAAVAASLCVAATGTDTMNSLRSPASANSLFSCRPTRGLISQGGVIPISFTQDAVGPIARCTKDVAILLTVMANVGYDDDDSATVGRPKDLLGKDYAASVEKGQLQGLRLGVLEGFQSKEWNTETVPVNETMDKTVRMLEEAGVVVVRIGDAVYDTQDILYRLDTRRYEYREALDEFLQRPDLRGEYPRSFRDLYDSNDFLVIPAQYEHIKAARRLDTSDARYKQVQEGIVKLQQTLQETLTQHNLDALIYPQQKCLTVKVGSSSQAQRNGILAAVTGFPSVCVPIGFSRPTEDAPIGVPVGMEVLGRPWSEGRLLQIAYQFEKLSRVRRPPLLKTCRERANVDDDGVLQLLPNTVNIPDVYPQGVLQ